MEFHDFEAEEKRNSDFIGRRRSISSSRSGGISRRLFLAGRFFAGGVTTASIIAVSFVVCGKYLYHEAYIEPMKCADNCN